MSHGYGAQSQTIAPPDFEIVFNSVPDLYLVLSPSLHIVAVSDAYLSATMTQRDAIVGRYLFDVFPDDPSLVNACGERNLKTSLELVLKNKTADTMAVQKYPIRRSDSASESFETRYWSPTNSPVFDPGTDKILYIIHRVNDVTEYVNSVANAANHSDVARELREEKTKVEAEVFRRAQEIQEVNRNLRAANEELIYLHQQLEAKSRDLAHALKTSDERFFLLVDGVKEYGIFMLDCEGTVKSWNRGAQRIFGYTEQEIVGHSFSMFFDESDRRAGIPQRELAHADLFGSADEQGWRVRKNGTKFWANGCVTALYDSDDKLRGYAKILRDLTERKRAESLLQSIVDTASEGIITLNSVGNIQSFNKASEKIFGYEASEVLGHRILDLIPEVYESLSAGIVREVFGMHRGVAQGIGHETIGQHKNGRKFPIEIALSEFQQDGETRFTALIRDITARKELEKQYHHSQKMEAIGLLAGGVAHDFNNLLTIIFGYSEMLLKQLTEQDGTRVMIGEIHHAASRAAALTRQLLAFSRQQLQQPQILDINECVREADSLLRRLIGEDIQLTTQLAASPSTFRGDPSQIDQVIMNLVVNARDAMPQGGTLLLSTRTMTADANADLPICDMPFGQYVALDITDSGIGIEPELQARIFEPFFTTKGVGKGTGLGLSVVDGIVKQSSGWLKLSSEMGRGSTFSIYFPVCHRTASVDNQNASQELIGGTETILLVEDELGVREFASFALESCGYNVHKARDAHEAMMIAQKLQVPIHLLISDIVLPHLSGYKLFDAIRNLQPEIKVLFLSGYAEDEISRRSAERNTARVLSKPFTSQVLALWVRSVLDETPSIQTCQ